MSDYRARFDDLLTNHAFVFTAPAEQVVVARAAGEVTNVLDAVDNATSRGAWAYGVVSYEAAAGLDPAQDVRTPTKDGPPLAWFAITDAPAATAAVASGRDESRYWTAPWQLQVSQAEHGKAVEQIRTDIAAGEYYQANLTARLLGRVVGDVRDFYADLAHAQRGSFNAFIDVGDYFVASASPELFVEWTRDELRCRPMKGTASRFSDPAADAAARERLQRSAKDAAENVMIVDLVRNDLGRVAETGTVRVSDLLKVEQYESVWQLASEISARPKPELTLTELFRALFPCGSVTGAPKAAAMSAIRALETAPRGVYCGAVGWVAPPTEPVRARFNVAIRTVTIDQRDGSATYGTGGGITIGSDPAAEFAEMLDKTAVLSRVAADDSLLLLETMAYDPAHGYRNIARHLRRLARSAAIFGFHYDEAEVQEVLREATASESRANVLRVALRLASDGAATFAVAPLRSGDGRPLRLVVDNVPVDPEMVWLHHKTSRREVYQRARARHPDCDDVLLVNSRGEVTEASIANVAARFGGEWVTPPLASGCLAGIGREIAIERGELHERVIMADDLGEADEIALVSSLRGWRKGHVR